MYLKLRLGISATMVPVKLTSHPHLVPRSRMSRSNILLPLGTCVAVAGQLCVMAPGAVNYVFGGP
jgi:hypothetical protein